MRVRIPSEMEQKMGGTIGKPVGGETGNSERWVRGSRKSLKYFIDL
jgi:hypothetical protein